MDSKKGLEIGDRFNHRGRGNCTFTEICAALEAMNPDPTSTFVLLDEASDEIEVSIELLDKIEIEVPLLCGLCLKPLIEGEEIMCNSCRLGLKRKLRKKI